MLAKYSVRKPYTIVVAVIAVLILGVISFMGMTVDLLPSIDLPYVIVMTTYPGASPDEVELGVTKPIEASLATISNLENLTSVSSANMSMVMLEFSQTTNMDSAIIEVNSGLDLVSGSFADSVAAPIVMRINPEMIPIMMTAVSIDGMDTAELSDYVDKTLIPQLERTGGVGSVSASGLFKQQIEVVISQQKIDDVNDRILGDVDAELSEQEDQLTDAQKKLNSGAAQLAKTKAEKEKQFDDAQKAIDVGKKQIGDATSKLTDAKKELEDNGKLLEAAYTAEKAVVEKLRAEKARLEALGDDITDAQKAELELIKAKLPSLEAHFAETTKQYNEYKTALDSIDSQLGELGKKQSELETQETKLKDGRKLFETEISKAESQIRSGKAKIKAALDEFESAREKAFENASLDGVITTSMISGILAAENFSMPAGYITEDGAQYLVKIGDKLQGTEEIGDLLLFSLGLDTVDRIYLKDVADITLTDNSDEIYSKINGENGVLLAFQKQSAYSTSEVSTAINAKLASLSAAKPELHFNNLMDQGVYMKLVTDSVLNNLMYGALLAILVLLFFLRSLRPTFIIAVSIPFSVVFAFVLMYFSGITLNVISLSGLALAVGMLVDNSIVVIENIYRMRYEGASAKEAAVAGAKQVAGAITASTLTTVCVFLPIVFTTGITRQLFSDMGLTIAYSLFASLIVALTLVPAISSGILRNIKEQKPSKHRIYSLYEKLLRGTLRIKPVILLAAVAIFVLCGLWIGGAGTSFMPDMNGAQMSATITLPSDATFDETCAQGDAVVERIMQIEDIDAIGVMQQSGMTSLGSGGNTLSLYMTLNPTERTNQAIANDIMERTRDLDCEIAVTTSNMDMSALYGSGIQIVIKGADTDSLTTAAKGLEARLLEIDGVSTVDNGIGETTSELRITVDKNLAMEYGLTVAQVYMDVADYIADSDTATTLMLADKEFPIVVINGETLDIVRSDIYKLRLTATVDGEEVEVPLADIAEIGETQGPNSIRRENQSQYIAVTAELADGYNIGLVSRDIEAVLADYELPAGCDASIEGESETINSALRDLVYMLLLAIALIYLIMVAQFQSLLSPFIVMFTIPLALTGGVLALMITGFDVSVISMLGFLVLVGVVVNNGIVLVDCINQLKAEGMPQTEAIVAAGKMRMRPIFMTAITTILGLVTMALGIGDGAELGQPLAVVTIGGLAYSTILTLFVVPAFYDVMNRKERRQQKKAKRLALANELQEFEDAKNNKER